MEIFEAIMGRVADMLLVAVMTMAAFATVAQREQDEICAGISWAGAAIAASLALGIRVGLMM